MCTREWLGYEEWGACLLVHAIILVESFKYGMDYLSMYTRYITYILRVITQNKSLPQGGNIQ